MNLNARISGVLIGGALVAEDQCPSTKPENVRRAFMVGRVKTKSLFRATGGNECLNQTEGSPWLVTSRLHDDGGLQGDGGKPE